MEREREQLSAFINEWGFLVRKTLEMLEELNEDELVRFVDYKAEIINKILPLREDATESDKQVIMELTHLEQPILGRMNDIKNEAAEWLLKRGMIRTQSQAYNSSYSADSLFIDRRR